jgi:predicted permease
MRRLRPQQLLVISEVALALVLVTGATLMVRSLGNLLRVDLGFRPDGVIAARLVLPLNRYPAAERSRFADQTLSRLRSMPGATAAAVSADLPLRGLESAAHLTYDGGTPEGVTYARHRVSPELFSTLGIPVLRGRIFEATDNANAPEVVVVSASTARRLWPGRNPIGQRIYPAGTDRSSWREVIGVVGDVRYRDLTTDLRAELSAVDVYFPFAQSTDETIEIALRGSADQQTLIAGLRAAVRDVDPTLSLFEVGTLDAALARETAGAQFGANTLLFLAGVALLLAGLGVYGLLAFVVGASSRDIAIRMAMGAGAPRVVGLVLRKGLLLTLSGVALGLLLVGPSTRALSHWLVGVRPSDPITILGVTLLLGAASALACWLPARRASLVDPQSVLKSE